MTLARATVALRVAMHALFVGLTGFVAADAYARSIDSAAIVVSLCVLMLVTYGVGVLLASRGMSRPVVLAGLALLSAEWIAVFALTPTAAFVAFPLFFLFLHVLPWRWGVAAVAAATAVVVVLFGWQQGYNVGAVIGPVVGAAVAVAFVAGFRTLQREVAHRQTLIDELLATRDELARNEHEAGALAERTRLGREIHDTVAQGLSSIQMLLHAAERADPSGAGVEHVRLARQTAAENLAESRRFIEARPPAALQNETLARALQRLSTDTDVSPRIDVTIDGDPFELPMPIETALLRVAQEAITNVRRHAHASRAAVTVTYMGDAVSLDVVDDGCGFDADEVAERTERPFGITGMRARIEELGGTFAIESGPDTGTAIAASFGWPE